MGVRPLNRPADLPVRTARLLRHEALKQVPVFAPTPTLPSLSSHGYEMENMVSDPVMRRGECYWLDDSN